MLPNNLVLLNILYTALIGLCWWLCHVNAMDHGRPLSRGIATGYGLLAVTLAGYLAVRNGFFHIPFKWLHITETALWVAVLAMVAYRREFMEKHPPEGSAQKQGVRS